MSARDNNQRDKVVGILGGMGPEATVDLMARIIAATPAQDDIDHIRMLVDNNPKVPSRIKALIEETGESPAPTMIAMAQGLAQQGADFLAMPCNTAHHYYADVANAVNIPFLNIVELTLAYIKAQQPQVKRIGLLASSALQKINLYEPYAEHYDLAVLYPEVHYQTALMDLIKQVKSKSYTNESLQAFSQAAQNLQAQQADVLVIACTELSALNNGMQFALPVYDASDVLAHAVVKHALAA